MFIRIGDIVGHSAAIYDVQYDGKYLYSASGDKFVARWNIDTLEQDKFAIQFPVTPYTISLNPSINHIAVGLSDCALHIFDIESRLEIKHLALHQKGIFALEYLPELNWLVAGDADGLLSIWKSSTYELVVRLPLDCGKIRTIIYNKITDSILVGSQDGNIYSISCITLNVTLLTHAHEGGVGVIVVNNKEGNFLTGGKDGHLRSWGSRWNEEKSLPAHNYMIYDILPISENLFITASRDKSMKVWDSKTLEVLQKLDLKLKGHRHSVNKLVKINDSLFASVSDDARILIWSLVAE